MTLHFEEHTISPSLPFEPTPGTVNYALTGRLRPDFKRAVAFGLLAAIVATLGHLYGDVRFTSAEHTLIGLAGSLLFLFLAALAVRSGASEVASVSRGKFGEAHAAVVGLLLTVAGYAATVLILLILLGVPPGRLLVSGAVTGVVLGVAAQQSLGNVVAGLVLLLNRPFQVGQEITLRSGALDGTYSGRVVSIGLTYVQLQTAEGPVLLPNSGVLASAVGPMLPGTVGISDDVEPAPPSGPAAGRTPGQP